MLPVSEVATFIIEKSDRISNLKLQKLLYYVQGWQLGITGNALFPERIEAWVHGPVVPEMFRAYRIYKWQPIVKQQKSVLLPVAASKHIVKVLSAYDKFSGEQLGRLSHSESPWLTARRGLRSDAPSDAVITLNSMRHFFGGKATRTTA